MSAGDRATIWFLSLADIDLALLVTLCYLMVTR